MSVWWLVAAWALIIAAAVYLDHRRRRRELDACMRRHPAGKRMEQR